MRLSLLFSFLYCTRLGLSHIYDERCVQCINVDVYFHVVAHTYGTIFFHEKSETLESLVPMIEENMKVVNYELNETPFVFQWRNKDNLTSINNSKITMRMCQHEQRMRLNKKWMLGDSKSINVYLGHNMKPGTFEGNTLVNSTTVGCASFPDDDTNGVWMNFEILPPQGNGLTLVHEFGHWLGLLHTYGTYANANEFDPCDPSNPGDFVDDTPIQTKFDLKNYTNETSADSCPDQEGTDSFWNIMNSVCGRRTCFGDRAILTEGQIQRMVSRLDIVEPVVSASVSNTVSLCVAIPV